MLIALSKGDDGMLSVLLHKALEGILLYSAVPLMFQPTVYLIIFSCMVLFCIINGLLLLLIIILKHITVFFQTYSFSENTTKKQQYKDLGNSQLSINPKSQNGIHKYANLCHYDFYLIYTF